MLIDPYHWQTVTIVDSTRESPDCISIGVSKPRGYRYQSGCHAIVRVTHEGASYIRQYSFASINEDETIRFIITRQPDGIVSSWFIDTAMIGDQIEISQSFHGPLELAYEGVSRLGMIAGGSGVVPMMSHIRRLTHDKNPLPFTLLYSTKSTAYCNQNEVPATKTIITRLTDSEPRFRDKEIISHLRDCSHVLICGSRPFVTHMRTVVAANLPNAQIHAESFSL